MNYRFFTTGMGLGLAVTIFYLLRRDLLHTRYAVWWLFVAFSSIILGVFPGLSDVLAGFLGIQYAPSLFFLTGLGLVYLKILTMDIDRSRQEQKLRRLAQEMAILESVVEETRKQNAGLAKARAKEGPGA